jgi:hypothetical protein
VIPRPLESVDSTSLALLVLASAELSPILVLAWVLALGVSDVRLVLVLGVLDVRLESVSPPVSWSQVVL